MPEKPHISWKPLSVQELKDFYEHDPKEYGKRETEVVVTLVGLVEQGKVRAFLTPDGKIYYQHNPRWEENR